MFDYLGRLASLFVGVKFHLWVYDVSLPDSQNIIIAYSFYFIFKDILDDSSKNSNRSLYN